MFKLRRPITVKQTGAEAGTTDLRAVTGLYKIYHPDGKSKLALRLLL